MLNEIKLNRTQIMYLKRINRKKPKFRSGRVGLFLDIIFILSIMLAYVNNSIGTAYFSTFFYCVAFGYQMTKHRIKSARIVYLFKFCQVRKFVYYSAFRSSVSFLGALFFVIFPFISPSVVLPVIMTMMGVGQISLGIYLNGFIKRNVLIKEDAELNEYIYTFKKHPDILDTSAKYFTELAVLLITIISIFFMFDEFTIGLGELLNFNVLWLFPFAASIVWTTFILAFERKCDDFIVNQLELLKLRGELKR